jgi:hypothetical protein
MTVKIQRGQEPTKRRNCSQKATDSEERPALAKANASARERKAAKRPVPARPMTSPNATRYVPPAKVAKSGASTVVMPMSSGVGPAVLKVARRTASTAIMTTYGSHSASRPGERRIAPNWCLA